MTDNLGERLKGQCARLIEEERRTEEFAIWGIARRGSGDWACAVQEMKIVIIIRDVRDTAEKIHGFGGSEKKTNQAAAC